MDKIKHPKIFINSSHHGKVVFEQRTKRKIEGYEFIGCKVIKSDKRFSKDKMWYICFELGLSIQDGIYHISSVTHLKSFYQITSPYWQGLKPMLTKTVALGKAVDFNLSVDELLLKKKDEIKKAVIDLDMEPYRL